MKKRTLALLLALVLVLALAAGCGNSNTPSNDSAAEPASEPAGEPDGGSPAEGPAVPDDPKANFPLADSYTTYSWFMPAGEVIGKAIDSFNENSVIKEMARLTNIDWEFISPPQQEARTQFNIIVAGSTIPDVMGGFSGNYNGGLDTAIDEGIIQGIDPFVEKYMPYYWAYLKANPDVERATRTDSGVLPGIGATTKDRPPEWGPMLRQDWLDEAGLDTPVTLADWEKVLTAFKDNGHGGTLAVMNTGYVDFFGNAYPVTSAFGVTGMGTDMGSPGYINNNGKAELTINIEPYKDYLKLIADWYAKGLVIKDFESMAQMDFVGRLQAGEPGIFCWNWQDQESFEGMIGGDANIEPITNPVLNEGDELHLFNYNPDVSGCCGFSAALNEQDLGVILQYFDYWWSDEGMILKNYGVEHEGFEYGEDGLPYYTDLLTKNPEPSYSFSLCLDAYTMYNSIGYADWTGSFRRDTLTPSALACKDLWSNDAAYYFPNVTLTGDEAIEASAMRAEIKTYVEEYTLSAIVGEVDIDATWDDYCARIETMGAPRLTEIYQAALDRYMNR